MVHLIEGYQPLTLEDIRSLEQMLTSKNTDDVQFALGILEARCFRLEPHRVSIKYILGNAEFRFQAGTQVHDSRYMWVYPNLTIEQRLIKREIEESIMVIREKLWSE